MPEGGRWASAGVAELPRCQIAWRVLDAQYFGVAQRRRRIFLVADFAMTGRRAAQILFEPDGLPGNPQAGEGERQDPPDGARQPPLGTGPALYDISHSSDVVHPLDTRTNTLSARMGTDGLNVPILSYGIAANIINRGTKSGGNGLGVQKELSYTLTAGDQHAVGYISTGYANYRSDEKGACLRASSGAVGGGSETLVVAPSDKREVIGTLCARDSKGVGNFTVESRKLIIEERKVRRLTPLECERLQGLPDHWTHIDDKTCSDSARYKAIGNGMTQPCADFVLRWLAKAAGSGLPGWT